jgi:hypothetical protein
MVTAIEIVNPDAIAVLAPSPKVTLTLPVRVHRQCAEEIYRSGGAGQELSFLVHVRSFRCVFRPAFDALPEVLDAFPKALPKFRQLFAAKHKNGYSQNNQ